VSGIYARPMPAARTLTIAVGAAFMLLAPAGIARAQLIPLPPPVGPQPQPDPPPAQPPPPSSPPSQPAPSQPTGPWGSLSISVNRYDLALNQGVSISGRLSESSHGNAGKVVVLRADRPRLYPKLGGIRRRATTDASGRYLFRDFPLANLRYTVSLRDEPSVRSAPRRIYVYARQAVNILDAGGGSHVTIQFFADGADQPIWPGARYAYFYTRPYGRHVFHRIGRARVKRGRTGEDLGVVRALLTLSAGRLPPHGYVTACTKTSPIAGMGRGSDPACGRRTLPG
jgi:hypothetical protein